MDLRTLLALGVAKEVLDKIGETITEREAQKIAEDPDYLEKKRIKAEQQEQKWTERAEKIANGFETLAQNLEQKQERHKQKQEIKKREKREAFEKEFQSLKDEFPLEVIYKRTDERWLANSEILDDHGNLKYTIRAKSIMNRRRIEILDENDVVLACSTEKRPLYGFVGPHETYSISISGITSELSGRSFTPYNWKAEEKGFLNPRFNIYNANNERITATLPSLNKEYTSVFIKSRELELHCILLYLIITTLPQDFSPAYYVYYEWHHRGGGE